MNRIQRLPRAVEYALIAIVALCFAASYGFNYGFDNQLVYFVKSLVLVNRGLLHADWFTHHTTHYHRTFIYLGALLLKLDSRGWAVAIAQFVCVFLGTLCMYRIVKRVAGAALAVPAFLLLLGMLFITRTSSVGTSYLFDTIFQPSTLGALGSIAATWLFVEERWFESGVALALGGIFHANYLVLAYPIFGLAHLALGSGDLKRRLIHQFVPLIAATIVMSPLLLAASRSPASANATDILFTIRSPHHYSPGRYERNFMPFAAWQMLGIGAGWLLHRTPNGKRLGAVLTGLLVTIWTGTLLTTLVDIPKVAQIFVWRFAPNADILSQILIACALAQALARPAVTRAYPRVAIALVCAGLGIFGLYFRGKNNAPLPRLLLAYFGLAVLARVLDLGFDLGRRLQPKLASALGELKRVLAMSPWALGVIVLYFQAPARIEEGWRRSTLVKDDDGRANIELYRWLRESSPRDAVYLTPPDLDGARFLGQRAIVVDWKAVPLIPSELLVWYERLCDVTGRRVGGTGDLSGYYALDRERLALIEAKYHPDYVVLRRGAERRFPSFPVVYQNGGYSVLKIVPPAQNL
jgi:Dolichyl-phosphate-mannose-protein mannosyltransferase